MKRLCLMLMLLVLSAGCMTQRPKIVVGNASDVAMGDVSVKAGDTVLYHEQVINPRSSGRTVDLPETYDGSAGVSWKLAKGDEYEDVVAIEPDTSAVFDGTIYIQLKDDPQARVFFLNDKEAKENVLPWSTPQEWEASPNIPGLGTQPR